MTTPEFQRLNALFDELADLPPERRRAHLDAATQISDATRGRIGRLIDAHERVGEATLRRIVDVQVFEARHWLGRRIGPYRVERELGHGGMGSVFMARRVEGGVEQVVAIKIVRPERLDENTLARFRLERQVLAMLRHPNIATMIDLGELEDGSPYVVMEFVEGVPVTAYAKDLDLKRKLALFLIVCDAVAYAHRNMIVHRDIKPGNILVEANGHPKLLDFGIAKPLLAKMGEVDVEQTGTSQQFFSIYSAAPEQLRGDVITVACDVYGLGTLLYELLAGKPALSFDGLTPGQIETRILTTEPAPPSALVPLDRDLDAIVMRCLRKNPEQRYASVEQLRDDIERHLSKRPVLARRGRWMYRAERFIARHLLLLAIVVGIFGILTASAVMVRRQIVNYAGLTLSLFDSVIPDHLSGRKAASGLDDFVQKFRDKSSPNLPDHLVGLARFAGGKEDDEAQLRLSSSEMAAVVYETVRDSSGIDPTVDVRRRFELLDAAARIGRDERSGATNQLRGLDSPYMSPLDEIATMVIKAPIVYQPYELAGNLRRLQLRYASWRDNEKMPLPGRIAMSRTLAVASRAGGLPIDAMQVHQDIVARMREQPDVSYSLAQSLLDLADAARAAGSAQTQMQAAAEAFDIAERLGKLDNSASTNARLMQSKARIALGIARVDAGDIDAGIALMEQTIDDLQKRERSGAPRIALLHANIGALLYDRTDYQEIARKHWMAAWKQSAASNSRAMYAVTAFAGGFMAKTGDHETAVEILRPLSEKRIFNRLGITMNADQDIILFTKAALAFSEYGQTRDYGRTRDEPAWGRAVYYVKQFHQAPWPSIELEIPLIQIVQAAGEPPRRVGR